MINNPDPTGLVLMGVIIGAKGLKGDVRIKSFTAVKENLAAYGLLWDKSGRESYSVNIKGEAKGQLIVRIEGVTDRAGAEALKGLELFIPREALPELEENEFYHSDLIGLEVVTTCGKTLGRVSAVDNYGAGDVLEITGGPYKGLVVPFEIEVVPKVDFSAGVLMLNPPDGLLEKVNEGTK